MARRAKRWWKSKTLWFNVVMSAAGAAEASLGILQQVLPINSYAVIAFTLAVGNAVLRVVTTTGLSR
jgi:hypothetical protein